MNFITEVVLSRERGYSQEVVEYLLEKIVFTKEASREVINRNLFNSEAIVEPTHIVRHYVLNHLMSSANDRVTTTLNECLANVVNQDVEMLELVVSSMKVGLKIWK